MDLNRDMYSFRDTRNISGVNFYSAFPIWVYLALQEPCVSCGYDEEALVCPFAACASVAFPPFRLGRRKEG